MSLGEDRVRTKFNPSNEDMVDQLKQATAHLIDLCVQAAGDGVEPEVNRLWSLAMTKYEEAAMWATKACTYGK